MDTIDGCDNRAAATASRRKRSTKAASVVRWVCSSFTATRRARTSSVASHTWAIPPEAMRWSRRYRPPTSRPACVPRDECSLSSLRPAGLLPRHPDDARSGVSSDDRADQRDADLVARKARRDHVEELLDVGRFAVTHTQSFHRGLLEQTVREPAQALFSRASLARLLDFSGTGVDERFDREQIAEQRLRPTDPSALLQVLERVEAREHPGASRHVLDCGNDRVGVRSVASQLRSRNGLRPEAERDRA